MEHLWELKTQAKRAAIEKLSLELGGLDNNLCNLLLQRGINSFEEAKSFFRPTMTALHDPMKMKDMDKAVLRIQDAIEKKEGVLIYGDYDVDGTTSVALVYSFLKSKFDHIRYYIPDRYKEGYGISKQGIDYAKANNLKLIVALDCGIKALEKIEYSNSQGIDFIVCDHHLPGDQLPNAIAVLDPKRKDCAYPFKELSGCGVGYKLMQALCDQLGWEEGELHDKLDLLAVSICADIVPIVGENRILTYLGLLKLNTQPQEGLKSMLEIAQMKKKNLGVTEVVFTIAPRINAAGRIEDAKNAVKLLLEKNTEKAKKVSAYINEQNLERRQLDQSITKEAIDMIVHDEQRLNAYSTVLYKDSWHKGVIGIVASRCIEHYYRPTIILTKSNGKITGSARSVYDFDVYEALSSCADLLEQYGGHKYAAGLTMEEENLAQFIQKFENVVRETITPISLKPTIHIDSTIELANINQRFVNTLKQFSPFGPMNMNPIFKSDQLKAKYPKIVGEKHLKLTVYQNNGVPYQAIGFNLADKMHLVTQNKTFSAAFAIEENEWNNRKSIQLNVKDIKEEA
ncbi:MAG: single-stranded-DNA-specific exonuclease RecJ [Verrucomicrobia bacterium]|nr:single-stranded-DNA-specific exonuclease RecJ [Verrucomicrobiota bacterium]